MLVTQVLRQQQKFMLFGVVVVGVGRKCSLKLQEVDGVCANSRIIWRCVLTKSFQQISGWILIGQELSSYQKLHRSQSTRDERTDVYV